MALQRQALALELKQIIQADRDANEILQEAAGIQKNIEQSCEKEIAILQEKAKNAHSQAEKRLFEEQERLQEAKAQDIVAKIKEKENKLNQIFNKNRENWVNTIYASIINE
jgi:cell fate (sporulation/competence/biofilm development) regulator YlbF (YheA/YmcA/DUF963 family)